MADPTPRRSLPEQPASTTSNSSSPPVRPVPTSRVLGRRRRSIGDNSGERQQDDSNDSNEPDSFDQDEDAIKTVDKDNKGNERKRIKLDRTDMQDQTTNGHGSASNSHPNTNSNSNSMQNGKEKANGAYTSAIAKHAHPPHAATTPYYGHDREEVTRLVIQTLNDLGYDEAADNVMQRSGFALESPAVASFRAAVLAADWVTAERHLDAATLAGARPERPDRPEASRPNEGLVLSPEASAIDMRFAIREQKYLEFLEQGDTAKALLVLRNELTPLCRDTSGPHRLSTFLMCQNPRDLFHAARWDGAAGTSRRTLLSKLSRFISPSVMLPEHRLAVLLQQVKYYQNSACLYHTNPRGSSLDRKSVV